MTEIVPPYFSNRSFIFQLLELVCFPNVNCAFKNSHPAGSDYRANILLVIEEGRCSVAHVRVSKNKTNLAVSSRLAV